MQCPLCFHPVLSFAVCFDPYLPRRRFSSAVWWSWSVHSYSRVRSLKADWMLWGQGSCCCPCGGVQWRAGSFLGEPWIPASDISSCWLLIPPGMPLPISTWHIFFYIQDLRGGSGLRSRYRLPFNNSFLFIFSREANFWSVQQQPGKKRCFVLLHFILWFFPNYIYHLLTCLSFFTRRQKNHRESLSHFLFPHIPLLSTKE